MVPSYTSSNPVIVKLYRAILIIFSYIFVTQFLSSARILEDFRTIEDLKTRSLVHRTQTIPQQILRSNLGLFKMFSQKIKIIW